MDHGGGDEGEPALCEAGVMGGLGEVVVEDEDEVEIGAVAHFATAELSEGEQAEAGREAPVDAVAEVEERLLFCGLEADICEVCEAAGGLSCGEAAREAAESEAELFDEAEAADGLQVRFALRAGGTVVDGAEEP